MKPAGHAQPVGGFTPRSPGARGGGASGAAGFTLMEVLLATILLAAGLALGFATLRAAAATAQRGEAMAARNERIRAASEFLRRRIGGAQGIVFIPDPATGVSRRFEGDDRSMRFVADLPNYLGRGGPHLHEFALAGGEGARTLRVGFDMVMAGQVIADREARAPEALAGGLLAARFAYRTAPRGAEPAPWRPTWEYPQALPFQVRVQVVDALGPWPDLVVTLPLAASYGATPGANP